MSKMPIILLLCLVSCSPREARRDPAPLRDDPARRLSKGECDTAVEHAIRLLDADPSAASFAAEMKVARERHVAECLRTATLRDYRCLMDSEDLKALGNCDVPGSGTGTGTEVK